MNISRTYDVRLIYASGMTKGCGPRDLDNILDVSRKNNVEKGITGALCYSSRGFLQCLEGPREAVNELYRRIVQDSRNENAVLITYGAIEERMFGQWSMAFIRTDEVDKKILAQYGVEGAFDPHALDERQALGLLIDTARERAAFLARQRNG